jgi:hypothetical protein
MCTSVDVETVLVDDIDDLADLIRLGHFALGLDVDDLRNAGAL